MLDPTAFNPAYAGNEEVLTLLVQGRTQWQNTQGAPKVGVFSAHSALPGTKLGVGLRASHQELSVYRNLRLTPTASYKIPFRNGVLSTGLGINLNLNSQAYNDLLLKHPEDKSFEPVNSSSFFSVTSGVFYATDRWYIGASLPDIYSLGDKSTLQYVGHAGIVFPVNADLFIKPNVLVNMPGQGAAYADINVNALFRQVFELGVSGRTNGILAGLARLRVNQQLSIGYSTDFALEPSAVYYGSSHELSVQFKFVFDKSQMPSPRFF
jgi:type IX secretion system PorP/SprF family membrane protein